MIDINLAEKLQKSYISASPYPHIVIDNFLPDFILKYAIKELYNHDVWYSDENEWLKEYQRSKFYYPESETPPQEIKSKIPTTALIFEYLNSDEFLNFLRTLTGIPDLFRDPSLSGGGIHKTGQGGRLSVHKDYMTHPQYGFERKVNMIIYLNEIWSPEWGGNLELWSNDPLVKVHEFEPIFNRAVIFNIKDAPHGHPHPLMVPKNTFRYSYALYYFVPKIADERISVRFYTDEETIL